MTPHSRGKCCGDDNFNTAGTTNCAAKTTIDVDDSDE